MVPSTKPRGEADTQHSRCVSPRCASASDANTPRDKPKRTILLVPSSLTLCARDRDGAVGAAAGDMTPGAAGEEADGAAVVMVVGVEMEAAEEMVEEEEEETEVHT
ncbi:hypothetical protein E4U14_001483 [Claviceps sp. LM454 group G7]|nr:hypothetical protein E4U14_001483 [Claviceps sp. LM454 group G7]